MAPGHHLPFRGGVREESGHPKARVASQPDIRVDVAGSLGAADRSWLRTIA